jgi:glycogen synthase
VFDYLQLFTHSLSEEAYGEVNFMARGIYHANIINTVSPTYAREIMTHEGGAGLDGLLRHRQRDLHGILNGLDYDEWNPSTDPRLAAQHDIESPKPRGKPARAPGGRRPAPGGQHPHPGDGHPPRLAEGHGHRGPRPCIC